MLGGVSNAFLGVSSSLELLISSDDKSMTGPRRLLLDAVVGAVDGSAGGAKGEKDDTSAIWVRALFWAARVSNPGAVGGGGGAATATDEDEATGAGGLGGAGGAEGGARVGAIEATGASAMVTSNIINTPQVCLKY